MKKQICVLLFCVALAFLAGCGNPFAEPEGPDRIPLTEGKGRVLIGLAQPKTLLPHIPAFSSYRLTFEYATPEVTEADKTVTSLPCTVELSPGEWTLTVTAYTRIEGVTGIPDGDYPAAEGEAVITVGGGTSTAVTVNLHGGISAGVKGVLRYDIGLPEDSGGGTLRVLTMTKAEAALRDLGLEASGTIALDPGYYLLQVEVFTGRERSKTELVHIYSGLTTEAAGAPYNFNTEEGVYLSVAELQEYLAAAPANTAETPYPVKLNVNMTSLASGSNSLGLLFAALEGKYISLDLGDSFGNIGNCYFTNPNKDRLVSLVLPEGLTGIGNYAFYQCSSLKSVEFPPSLQSMGNETFHRCVSLVSVDLSACASLTAISERAFLYCTALEDLRLPPSLQRIDYQAFDGCSSLVSLDLSPCTALVSIDGEAFYYNTSLEDIRFPASLASIGEHAFQGCSSLRTVDLSPCTALESLGSAFYWCSQLEEVALPPGLKAIGGNSFRYCYALKDIPLPASLETIGASAFYQCSALGSEGPLSLPASVTSIGSEAFRDCADLELVIPANSALESIGVNAFSGCDFYSAALDFSGLQFLANIDLSGSTAVESLDLSGCVRLTAVNNISACTALERVDLSGTKISSLVLSGNTAVETVDLSDCPLLSSVNFSGCTSLVSLTLPATLNAIAPHAFANCDPSLTFTVSGSGGLSVDAAGKILKFGTVLAAWPAASGNVNIPEGFTAINSGALEDAITALVLPSSLTNFANIINDLTTLETADFSACTAVTSISGTMFSNALCPAEIILPSSVTTISGDVFAGSGFTSIDLSACTALSSMPELSNCASLVTLKLPVRSSAFSGLTGAYFRGCTALTEFDVGGSGGYYRTAGGGAILLDSSGRLVAYPSAKNAVVIPEGITVIFDGSFSGNTLITSLAIPSSVSSLGPRAFNGCTNLASFNTGANTAYTTAGGGALLCTPAGVLVAWPSASGTIQLPAGITGIGDYAFYDNDTITAADFSGSAGLITIGNYVFGHCGAITSLNLSNCTALSSIGDGLLLGLAGTRSGNFQSVDLSNCPALDSIGYAAFLGLMDIPLTVTITAVTPPDLGSLVFHYSYYASPAVPSGLVIYVPAAAVDAYKAAAGWNVYAAYIQAIP